MKAFELHFNPDTKEYIAESFIFEPENAYERALGSLYLVAELKKALPKSKSFLNKLAVIIKKNYYTLSIKNPEKALSFALKKVNDFLAEEVKKNNVFWLGNLSLGVVSVSAKKSSLLKKRETKYLNLCFSKTGRLKIILLRKGLYYDIGKNIKLQDIEPYPLKVFQNILTGKLEVGDTFLLITENVYNFLKERKVLSKLSNLSLTENINEDTLKKLIPEEIFKKETGVSGVCLIGIASGKISFQKTYKRKINLSFAKEKIPFLKNIYLPVIKTLNRLAGIIKNFKKLKKEKIFAKIKLQKKRQKIKRRKTIPKKNIFKLSFKKLKILPRKIFTKKTKNYFLFKPKGLRLRKLLILFFVLGVFLFFGFLWTKEKHQDKKREFEEIILGVKTKVNRAEGYLLIKENEKANNLLIDAFNEISSILKSEKESNSKQEILLLKKEIEEKLNKLNNLSVLNSPKIVKNLKNKDIIEKKKELCSLTDNPCYVFLPNARVIWKTDKKWKEGKINFSETKSKADIMAGYYSNLYFLNKENCEILKYSEISAGVFGKENKWLKEKNVKEKCKKPKSLAIDGSIWILNNDNSISRFYKGYYKETLKLNIFPKIKNITKIKTSFSLPYLYLLEPCEKRIIIIDKKGKTIKQIKSEKFDNLIDFEISKDGKRIWILNRNIIYQVEI